MASDVWSRDDIRNVLMAQVKGLRNSGRSDDYLAGGFDTIDQIAASFGIVVTPPRMRATWKTGEQEVMLIEDGAGWE